MANVCKLEGFDKVFFDKIILCVRCLGLVPPFPKERRDLVNALVKTLDSSGWPDNFAETMLPMTETAEVCSCILKDLQNQVLQILVFLFLLIAF